MNCHIVWQVMASLARVSLGAKAQTLPTSEWPDNPSHFLSAQWL